MTDFILLTGFLGSGKTTLLVDFLRHPEAADTAVIVNEAGEIDIDGAVIAADAGKKIWWSPPDIEVVLEELAQR